MKHPPAGWPMWPSHWHRIWLSGDSLLEMSLSKVEQFTDVGGPARTKSVTTMRSKVDVRQLRIRVADVASDGEAVTSPGRNPRVTIGVACGQPTQRNDDLEGNR